MTTTTKPNHIGRKIARIRELRGMKQETLAEELGISQQSVSSLEKSEKVEDETLDKVSEILKVSPEAIRHFSEEAVFNIINNTFKDNSANNNNYFCTIDPVEKIVELYERLVQAEKDKVVYLEKYLQK
ncbi:helix-turn-helix domain-containing protein [Autumnicola musiva]|uniref:Helix-turn-helix transcriptional regulator n=1 Tax=Autumnicola musiva TaxID=3075589 RepID=A0ABU3D719_9FLAO|nr:helix-turn-helix transcriptional regulator [Zunongwangia sp. F117]MDT0677312.1 helix-turn-helix transcriptional regulator [Zunongwangia sp. F117]